MTRLNDGGHIGFQNGHFRQPISTISDELSIYGFSRQRLFSIWSSVCVVLWVQTSNTGRRIDHKKFQIFKEIDELGSRMYTAVDCMFWVTRTIGSGAICVCSVKNQGLVPCYDE